MTWQVALKPGQRRKLAPGSLEAQVEKVKASIRAKVEHPFLDVKQRNYAKVRYRGLAKNTERIAHIAGTIQSDEDPTRRGRLIQGAVGAKVRYAAENSCKARGYRPVRRANRPRKHDREPTEAPDSH